MNRAKTPKKKRNPRPIVVFQAAPDVKDKLRAWCKGKRLGFRSKLINEALRRFQKAA